MNSLENITETMLINHCLPYSDLEVLFNMDKSCLNSNANSFFKSNSNLVEKYFKKYKNYIQLDKYFSDSFIPKAIYQTLPQLSFQAHHMGGTHYLDRFISQDLNSPIMRGIDCYRRPFITLKYKTEDWELIRPGQDNLKIKGEDGIFTIFQRYTGGSGWVKSSNYRCPILYESAVYIDEKYQKIIIKNIIELLLNKPISVYNYYTDSIVKIKCQLVSQ